MKELNHPAIQQLIDAIEDEKFYCIVKEYIEGETLDAKLSREGAQPVDRVISWGKQLCDVLWYLHTLNPPHIHCDIKPANIVLTPNGQIKLFGFETMRLYDSSKNQDTCYFGTRGYAAPEQYGGLGQPDARTDIYAVGITLFNLVTGVSPLGPSFVIKPIRQINAALPIKLEKIINKCTELDPRNRFQNCKELMKALDKVDNSFSIAKLIDMIKPI